MIRTCPYVAVGLLLFATAPCGCWREQKLETALIGSWNERVSIDGDTLEASVTFIKDHTIVLLGAIDAHGWKTPIAVSGTWKTDGDAVTYTISTSSAPHLLPIGAITTDRIKGITAASFDYEDAKSGSVGHAVRAP